MIAATLKIPYLISKNTQALRKFYSHALGLPVRFQDEDKWCQMGAGALDFAISNPEEASPCPGGVVLVFSVENLQTAKADILQAGGQVLHERSMGAHGNVYTCLDPEGNYFQIHAKASPHA